MKLIIEIIVADKILIKNCKIALKFTFESFFNLNLFRVSFL